MGSNKNSSKPGGSDPRGTSMNMVQQQTDRFNNQQGPMVNAMAQNYGRGSEANYGDYTDIMNNYRDIASGGGSTGSPGTGGSGGGGGGYSAFTVNPGKASYVDPFKSYEGYTEFSKTGGYSPEDIANMRSRGISPIRAAYENAGREVSRQRTLQGGYSANAGALQAKMAREQGQSAADAAQNVEAGLAEARNKGRLAGLGGMSGIETSRLGADVDLSKFNTDLDFQGQQFNAAAQARAQSANNASSAAAAGASMADRMAALKGMTALYGTNPGMSETFGNQLLQGVNSGGNFGASMVNATNNQGTLPGQYDTTMNRITQGTQLAAGIANPWLDPNQRKTQQTQQPVTYDPNDYPTYGPNQPYDYSDQYYGDY